jgi:hypothetical protein
MQTNLHSISKKNYASVLIATGTRRQMADMMAQKNETDTDHWYQTSDAATGTLIASTANGGGCGAEARYRKKLTDALPNLPRSPSWPWPTKTGRWGPRTAANVPPAKKENAA